MHDCRTGLDLPGGLGGGFDPQDRSLTPPAKVGQMYWGGGCKLTPPETTQRLCLLLMLLVLSTDNNCAAILIFVQQSFLTL